MSDSFTPKISDRTSVPLRDRICAHMNEDHADAVLIYAQRFGTSPNSTAAKMLSIDAQGMNLTAEVSGETLPKIAREHESHRLLKDG